MTMQILGLGTATPAGAISQSDAAEAARLRCCSDEREARLLRTLYRQTNVRRRGSVLASPAKPQAGDAGASEGVGLSATPAADFDAFYERPHDGNGHGPTVSGRMRRYAEGAPELAVRAATAALAEAAVAPGEVRQLVVVSCTGFVSPGLDIRLINVLKLRADIGRTIIGFMGCHGAINGLRVAEALAAARPGEAVLLCCVELCSLHFQYGWDPQQIVANALFADGAAAVVGKVPESQFPSPESESEGAVAQPHGTRDTGHGTLASTASTLIPDSLDDMTWTIGDHGFRMTLSPRVPGLIERHLRPWLEGWLAEQGLSVSDVGSWAIHPGGPRIVESAVAALGLDPAVADASRAVLSHHGNMSSPTVLFILDRLRKSGAGRPCVMLAFGPGLVAEAALVR